MINERFIRYAERCITKLDGITNSRDIEEYLEIEDIDIQELSSAASYMLKELLEYYKKQQN